MKAPNPTSKSILKWAVLSLLVVSIGCSGNKKPNASDFQKETVVEETNLDPLKNKGIGPIREIILKPIDTTLVVEGKLLFEQLCSACHKIDKKFVGPPPSGILERRTPEWVLNMIMNPEEMIQKDPIAKQLFIEYNGAPMANQNVSEDEARRILEYFRTL
ncbi:MAG: cytochrome c [Cyclobacteriaceae bacterium]